MQASGQWLTRPFNAIFGYDFSFKQLKQQASLAIGDNHPYKGVVSSADSI
jgi:hypothetical protein